MLRNLPESKTKKRKKSKRKKRQRDGRYERKDNKMIILGGSTCE